MTDRVSIQAQRDHVDWMIRATDRLEREIIRAGLCTAKDRVLHVAYRGAVQITMRWLVEHGERIRRYVAHREEIDRLLALDPQVRAAILDHGPTVAELAVQMAERVAIAEAGGPVR